jgi:hypothetical protein
VINWDELQVQAQAGDALIKLGIYLSTELKQSKDRSNQLQSLESDSHLATVFGRWKTQGDLDLVKWGDNLSQKRKATVVEALLWQKFGAQVMATDASSHLRSLLKTLTTS